MEFVNLTTINLSRVRALAALKTAIGEVMGIKVRKIFELYVFVCANRWPQYRRLTITDPPIKGVQLLEACTEGQK